MLPGPRRGEASGSGGFWLGRGQHCQSGHSWPSTASDVFDPGSRPTRGENRSPGLPPTSLCQAPGGTAWERSVLRATHAGCFEWPAQPSARKTEGGDSSSPGELGILLAPGPQASSTQEVQTPGARAGTQREGPGRGSAFATPVALSWSVCWPLKSVPSPSSGLLLGSPQALSSNSPAQVPEGLRPCPTQGSNRQQQDV